MVKRVFDLALSGVALLALSPVMVVIAGWIKLDSPGPVFFRQTRVGRGGKNFEIIKFRTMVDSSSYEEGRITLADDSRITRSGAFLRRYKLDELPQLWNVLRGEMSLVGPRPEVPEYVQHYPEEIRAEILSIRPGLTDYAALEFIDEATLMSDTEDADHVYRTEILPAKLELYRRYVRERNLWVDLGIILRTMVSAFVRRRSGLR